jgi:hypothetical protein
MMPAASGYILFKTTGTPMNMCRAIRSSIVIAGMGAGAEMTRAETMVRIRAGILEKTRAETKAMSNAETRGAAMAVIAEYFPFFLSIRRAGCGNSETTSHPAGQ